MSYSNQTLERDYIIAAEGCVLAGFLFFISLRDRTTEFPFAILIEPELLQCHHYEFVTGLTGFTCM